MITMKIMIMNTIFDQVAQSESHFNGANMYQTKYCMYIQILIYGIN